VSQRNLTISPTVSMRKLQGSTANAQQNVDGRTPEEEATIQQAAELLRASIEEMLRAKNEERRRRMAGNVGVESDHHDGGVEVDIAQDIPESISGEGGADELTVLEAARAAFAYARRQVDACISCHFFVTHTQDFTSLLHTCELVSWFCVFVKGHASNL
jgi:hypothetical protein